MGGQLVSDVRFADDQGMLLSTERGLQKLMNKLNETAKDFGMKTNVQKQTNNGSELGWRWCCKYHSGWTGDRAR